MLKEISISGFRGVRESKVKGLGSLVVVTGENGAGKTTLLEAGLLLLARRNPVPIFNLQAARGMERFGVGGPSMAGYFSDYAASGRAEISGKSPEDGALRLTMEIGPGGREPIPRSGSAESGLGFGANAATFRSRDKKGVAKVQLSWWVEQQLNGLPQFKFTTGAVPTQERETGLLMHPNTRHLAQEDKGRFDHIRKRKQMEQLIRIARRFDPRLRAIEYLELPNAHGFHADIGRAELVPVGLLGGGLSNLLTILIGLLYVKGGVLFVDEFENGIHFQKLEWICGELERLSEATRTQMFLATHSGEAVRAIAAAAKKRKKEDDLTIVHARRGDDGAVHYTCFSGKKAIDYALHGDPRV